MDKLVEHTIKMLEIVDNERGFYKDMDGDVADIARAVYDTILRVQILEYKAYRKTEPTISKMEQVDESQTNADQHVQRVESVETMSCQECKWWFTDSLKPGGYCQSLLYNHECRYEPEVDCSWK